MLAVWLAIVCVQRARGLLTFLGIVQPLDKLGHLFEENGFAFDRVGFLVPLEDNVFGYDFT